MRSEETLALARCRAAIVRSFPALEVRSVRVLRGGWDFLTLEVDGRWVFRFPVRRASEARIQHEFGVLPLIARRIGVPVPVYRFRQEPTRDFPHRFGGYARLGGVRVDRARLAARELGRVGTELGRAIRRLHRIPARDAVAAGLPYRTPNACRQGVLRWGRRVAREVRRLLDPTSRRRLDRLLERLARPTRPRFATVVTHNDLLPVHVLADPSSGRLTGLIDWGDVEFADPAFDFGVMGAVPGLGPAMVRAYGGPSDGGFLERADAYRRLVASHTVVHARERRDPALRARGLREFARALAAEGPFGLGGVE
ncbi:MAG: phosphotransferase family protein [Thermoplasmata archaeon]